MGQQSSNAGIGRQACSDMLKMVQQAKTSTWNQLNLQRIMTAELTECKRPNVSAAGVLTVNERRDMFGTDRETNYQLDGAALKRDECWSLLDYPNGVDSGCSSTRLALSD